MSSSNTDHAADRGDAAAGGSGAAGLVRAVHCNVGVPGQRIPQHPASYVHSGKELGVVRLKNKSVIH